MLLFTPFTIKSFEVCYLLLQVVRCFEDNDIVHVSGEINPRSDIDVINLELVFSDLDQVCQFSISLLSWA